MKTPLVIKYRPKKISEYIFNDPRIEEKVKQFISEGTIPHILLSGSAGTGKSSLARVLTAELNIQDSDVLRVNASLDNGVGYVRDVITPWCKRAAFSPFKVVVLEEAEKLTFSAQKALLDVIEEHTNQVRWILTCNYPQKLDPAIHSRMTMNISLKEHDEDTVIEHLVDIMESEEIVFKDDMDFLSHVDAYMPDIRKIINSIEEHLDADNVLNPLSTTHGGATIDEWVSVWSSPSIDVDKAIEMTEAVDQNNFEEFYEIMYTNSSKFPDEGSGLVLLSQYLDRAQRAANQRLHLKAFIYHVFVVGES